MLPAFLVLSNSRQQKQALRAQHYMASTTLLPLRHAVHANPLLNLSDHPRLCHDILMWFPFFSPLLLLIGCYRPLRTTWTLYVLLLPTHILVASP